MTVIAYDGKYLAADKQVSWGSTHGTVTKVFKLKKRHYVCFTGAGGSSMTFLEWFKNGKKKESYPKFAPDNECSAYEVLDGKLYLWATEYGFYEIEDKRFSSGAGQDFAHAAMYLGKNAIEAVQVAIDLSHVCGNGIDWFDVSL